MNQHPHLHQFVRKCLEKNFIIAVAGIPLFHNPCLQHYRLQALTFPHRQAKNRNWHRSKTFWLKCCTKRCSPLIKSWVYTRDTHKYRQLFTTDIPSCHTRIFILLFIHEFLQNSLMLCSTSDIDVFSLGAAALPQETMLWTLTDFYQPSAAFHRSPLWNLEADFWPKTPPFIM